MFKDTNEPSTVALYPQNVELFGVVGSVDPEPIDFRSRLLDGSAGLYPQDAIESMRDDKYDPVIIGYTHGNSQEVSSIENKLSELQRDAEKPLSVLLEIDPRQVGWIKDFLSMERDFKATGLIHGSQPRPDEAQRMEAYRQQLRRTHGEGLALWCLDAGMDVSSIEHPDVKDWIAQDRGYFDEDEEWGFAASQTPREFVTAIKRDAYGLRKMNEVRPDVILTGYMHALKYDALLNRSGQNTFYYLCTTILWQQIARHWEDAHRDAQPTQF